MVDIEEIKNNLAEIFSTFKSELLGLPGRLANDLAKITDPAKARYSLQEELRRTLNNLSKKLEAVERVKK